MKKLMYMVMASTLIFGSCTNQPKKTNEQTQEKGLVAKTTISKAKQVKVEFIGSTKAIIKNHSGKASLYAVQENIADVPATEISTVKFEAAEIPFMVTFILPEEHRTLIHPAVKDADQLKYYVTLDWDSDGDGKVGNTDVVMDFNKAFPNVDITKELSQVFVK